MSATSEKALLLMNLGSPDAPETKAVKRYLNEFLMDSRVLDFNGIFRFFLVRGIITPFRSSKTAAAYSKVWTDEGSPLVVLTNKLADAVRAKVSFPVKVAMRYGNPSPKKAFDDLLKEQPGIKEVIVLPLYPHYTMSSYETAVVYAQEIHKKNKYPFALKFISPFYNREDYLNALANSIRLFLMQDYDKILFSYHGLPERHMVKDDIKIQNASGKEGFEMPAYNYQKQCLETTDKVAKLLNIPAGKYETAFQSRLKQAGNEWIKPYTQVRLNDLPNEGVKKLLVVCPAFINDCLETLEEIKMQGKEDFVERGGKDLIYIPCLNDNADWVDTVVKWANELMGSNG
jgi:protoporphyrin/coproporphyrin ferrochelatase